MPCQPSSLGPSIFSNSTLRQPCLLIWDNCQISNKSCIRPTCDETELPAASYSVLLLLLRCFYHYRDADLSYLRGGYNVRDRKRHLTRTAQDAVEVSAGSPGISSREFQVFWGGGRELAVRWPCMDLENRTGQSAAKTHAC